MPTPLDAAYLTALGIASPWVAKRLLTSIKGRANLREKLTGDIALPAKTRPRVWFHGVSVGEIHLLRHVVTSFISRRPDCEVVVSASTETGLIEARNCFENVVPWPHDFSWSVRRALDSVQPDLLVLAESELWPGMLAAAQRRRIPTVVINGRLSPKSAKHWRAIGPLARMLFNQVDCFAVQTQEYADNLSRLGVPADRIVVTGSVKYDGVQTERANPQTHALADLFDIQPDDVIWVAGSTQAPEEEGCLRIYQDLVARHRGLRLILVPRQKDRFDEVADLLQRSNIPFVRRSALPCPVSPGAIILVDTIGELRAVWGLADIAFVGGSLDGQRGGQNMIEPAAYGAAVTFGPHVWNFRATAEQLVGCGGALQVNDFAQLATTIEKLLDQPIREQFGERAKAFVASQQGATERTLDLLDRYLPRIARVAVA
jgi:3-deoxy-D-manno-octulosonic-acid transferase